MSDSPSAPTFERDIKPLFRDQDVKAMAFAFDLGRYEDVANNSDGILSRLESGEMPCDGAWPEDRVDLFRRWTAAGSPR